MWSFLNGWRIVVMVLRRKGMCRWQMGRGLEGGKDLRSGEMKKCRLGQSPRLTKNILIGTESATGLLSGTGWHRVAVYLGYARALAREGCLRRTQVYPVPSRAISTLRTPSLCLARRRRHRDGSAAGDAVARWQGRC